jgi:putative adhesin
MKLACFVVALLLMPASYAAAQRYPFERTFNHSGPVTHDIRTERGAIDVSVGQPGRVVVSGTVTVRVGWNVPVNAVELAKRVSERPPIVSEGGNVTLRPPEKEDERRAATVAYSVRVPPDTAVIAESDSGALNIESVDGRVEAHTQSSSLTLTRIGGDVRAQSGSGAVSIAHVNGALDVKTSSSGIVARELAGNLTARTGSGRLEVSFAGPANADVETQSSSISVTGLDGALLARTNSGEIHIAGRPGRPAGDWRVTTGSSRIRFDIDRAARDFDLDLSTGSGSVEVQGVHVDGVSEQRRVRATAGAGGSRIEATSRSGSISLRR